MTEQEYKTTHYPKDVIKIGEEFFPLPLGFKLVIETKEIGSTLTTADGTKRKDIIAKNFRVSFKYDQILIDDVKQLETIVTKIEQSEYGTEKVLFLKQNTMPETPTNLYDNFRTIKIDIAETSTINYTSRTKIHIAQGFTFTIN